MVQAWDLNCAICFDMQYSGAPCFWDKVEWRVVERCLRLQYGMATNMPRLNSRIGHFRACPWSPSVSCDSLPSERQIYLTTQLYLPAHFVLFQFSLFTLRVPIVTLFSLRALKADISEGTLPEIPYGNRLTSPKPLVHRRKNAYPAESRLCS